MPRKTRKTAKSSAKTPSREALKARLLLATLLHVEELGWSEEALLAGAATARIDPSRALSLFPGGGPELVHFFAQWADAEMLKALPSNMSALRVRERVALAVRTRLELMEPYKAAVAKALAMEVRPWRAPGALKVLYGTVDAVWRAAGDTATDFNFYTKRALLAGVYTSTLLFWLNDRSDDQEATWDFLDRRIENVMQIGRLTGRFKEKMGAKVSGVRAKAAARRRAA